MVRSGRAATSGARPAPRVQVTGISASTRTPGMTATSVTPGLVRGCLLRHEFAAARGVPS